MGKLTPLTKRGIRMEKVPCYVYHCVDCPKILVSLYGEQIINQVDDHRRRHEK